MNLSGILVVVPPERLEEAIAGLRQLPGVDVHHTDPATGRIVITQEGETIAGEVDGLKRIKALPYVILAEMVYHQFEESTEVLEGIPAELEGEGGLARVPPFLNE